MRKLYPINNDKIPTLEKLDSFKLTEAQYDALLASIDALTVQQAADEQELDDYKAELRNSITSQLASFGQLTVTDAATIAEAVISELSSTNGTITTLSSENITASVISATRAAITQLVNVDSADITTVNSTTVNATTGNFTEINVDDANITNYSIDNGNISNLTAGSADITTETVGNSVINNATIATLGSTDATITNADINKATISDTYSERLYNVYFNHNKTFNRQVIDSSSVSADGDCWCVLPKFTNGHFYLIAKNGTNGPFLWSLEILNSLENVMFRWSNAEGEHQYLKDVELINDDNDKLQFIQIHFNTNNLATHIYFQCTDFNTTTPPSYYAVKQYDGIKNFEFTRLNGTYLPNSIFAGDFHADTIEIDSVEFETVTINKHIMLPRGYDQYGAPIGHTSGNPGDYVTPVIDEYNNEGVQWKEPIKATVDGRLSDSDDLITENAVSSYNGEKEGSITYTDAYTDGTNFYDIDFISEDEPEGTITSTSAAGDYIQYDSKWYRKTVSTDDPPVVEYWEVTSFGDGGTLVEDSTLIAALDAETPVAYTKKTYKTSSVTYNIKHLGNGTEVHGDATIDRDLTVGRAAELNRHLFVGSNTEYEAIEADNDKKLLDDALVIKDDGVDPESKIYRKRTTGLVTTLKELMAREPNPVDKKPVIYDAEDDTYKTSDKIDIEEGNFNKVITNTLYVNGTAHINNTEEHDVEGDYLTLRANNNTALANGTYSGIIINHYNSAGDLLMIVADNTGTARLGTGSGTRTTYSELYYDGNIYFTDPEDKAGTTVEPEGVLIEWQSYERTDDYEHWTDAEWIVITFTDTEPILTRDESVDMSDKALIQWSADGEKAVTIPLPTNDEDVLTAHVVGNETTTTVYTDGTNFYGADMIATTEPSGTAGTPTTVGQFIYDNDVWFACVGTTFYDSVDSFTDNTNWTEVTDPELIAILEAQDPVTISEVVYTETLDPTIEYQWKEKQAGSYVFASMAAYNTYIATHNIPNGSQIIIENEVQNVFGDDING